MMWGGQPNNILQVRPKVFGEKRHVVDASTVKLRRGDAGTREWLASPRTDKRRGASSNPKNTKETVGYNNAPKEAAERP